MVVGGCYPFVGPNPSCIANAYEYALAQIDWQAEHMGANAVIGLRTVAADQWYVLVTGIAICVDAQYEMPSWAQKEERSRWPANMWDFVSQWTQDL